MQPTGLASVEQAKATGMWDATNDVDAFVVPPGLDRALATQAAADHNFAAFPSSVRPRTAVPRPARPRPRRSRSTRTSSAPRSCSGWTDRTAPCRTRSWTSPGRLQLGDAAEQYGLVAPEQRDAVSSSTCIYVADVDAVFAAAVAHGATVREKPDTFVTGDRFASVIDPFGHRWAIMTKVEDVTPEESDRRLADWAAQQAAQ